MHTLSDYESEIQNLVIKENEGKLSLGEILKHIDKKLKEHQEEPQLLNFFKGEQAFFKGSPTTALEYYKKATQIPSIDFYYSRANAHSQKRSGNFTEAIHFSQKALEYNTQDFLSIKLLEQLYEATNNQTQKEHWKKKKHTLIQNTLSPKKEIENLFFSKKREGSWEEQGTQPETTSPPSFLRKYLHKPKQSEAPTHTLDHLPSTPHSSPFKQKTSDEILQEIRTLVPKISNKGSSELLEEQLGLSLSPQRSLDQLIQMHQTYQQKQMSHYVEQSESHTYEIPNFLSILHSWDGALMNQHTSTPQTSHFLKSHSKTEGGIFFRWQGKGIAINPGKNFLNNFHKEGLFINAIDFVIVTRQDDASFYDVEAIHALNYQRNLLSKNLHVINYYLNQSAYRSLSSRLPSHFKQERSTIHCLEMFIDSPDLETLKLNEFLTLSYFTSLQESENTPQNNIGIRIDLTPSTHHTFQTDSPTSLAFLSGMKWSPSFASHLQNCNLILAGFEETSSTDFNKMESNPNSLGYYGTYSLLEHVAPQMLISCEYNGADGDIRLEIAKKLRQEHAIHQKTNHAHILPGDQGLLINLENLHIRCSITEQFFSPNYIHVIKPNTHFSTLQFINSSCML